MPKTFNSDTLSAFMYLADKPTHSEYADVLKEKFPDCTLRSLHKGDIGEEHTGPDRVGHTNNSKINLTIQGLALANEIRTNDNARFYNKAAFILSIISLCISVASAVLAVVFGA